MYYILNNVHSLIHWSIWNSFAIFNGDWYVIKQLSRARCYLWKAFNHTQPIDQTSAPNPMAFNICIIIICTLQNLTLKCKGINLVYIERNIKIPKMNLLHNAGYWKYCIIISQGKPQSKASKHTNHATESNGLIAVTDNYYFRVQSVSIKAIKTL